MYDRLAKLVQRLHDKSQRGEITWQKGVDGKFETSLPGHTIVVYSPSYKESKYWGIRIYNEEGEMLEDVDDNDLAKHIPGHPWEEILKEIHEIARRKALRIDQALDNLIVELEK